MRSSFYNSPDPFRNPLACRALAAILGSLPATVWELKENFSLSLSLSLASSSAIFTCSVNWS